MKIYDWTFLDKNKQHKISDGRSFYLVVIDLVHGIHSFVFFSFKDSSEHSCEFFFWVFYKYRC